MQVMQSLACIEFDGCNWSSCMKLNLRGSHLKREWFIYGHDHTARHLWMPVHRFTGQLGR